MHSPPRLFMADYTTDDESEADKPSAFLPKDFFGEHECKPGDVLSIKVKAVDPETGEKEVQFDGYDEEEPSDTMEAMDREFPVEEMG